MNNIVLSGRIVRELELKQTQNGKSYTRNSIAVRRGRKNAEGKYDSDFFEFEAWNGIAESLTRYGKKGGRIEIQGELQNNNYQKNDGQMVYGTKIIVNRVEIIDYAGDDQQQPTQEQNPYMTEPQYQQPQMQGFGNVMQQTSPGAIVDENLPF